MRRSTYLVILVLAFAGCQTKLQDTRTIDVMPGEIKTAYVDGPRFDQKVTTEYSSSAGEVSVFVCLRKHERAVSAAAETGQIHPELLASRLNAALGSIESSIPAKEDFAIIILGAHKPTTLTLKINGR